MAQNQNQRRENEQQAPVLPPPAVTEADLVDMGRYAGQAEAQHAIQNERPPWVDFVNPDGSWHINQQYRGGVPDWWRDHSRNQGVRQYISEYDAIRKQLEDLAGQNASAGMPGGYRPPQVENGGTAGMNQPGRWQQPQWGGQGEHNFAPLPSALQNVPPRPQQGGWNRAFPGAPEPRFSPYMAPQMPRQQVTSQNPYTTQYQYPAMGAIPGPQVSTARPAPTQWYERFQGQEPQRKPWANW